MDVAHILERPALAGTEWGVALRPLRGRPVEVGATRLLRTASVAKVFLLVEVAARVERGDLDLGLLLDRRRVPPVGDSGVWQHLRTETLPLGDVAALVGAASDNWATNVLLDLVGLPAVAATAAALAPGGSRLLDAVRDRRTSEHPATLSVGCAADWADLMHRLRTGRVVGRAVSDRVLGWLAPGCDLSMVAGALGLDPLAHAEPDRGLAVWSKTGTDEGVRADVGCATGPRGEVAYAVLCNWDPAAGDPRDEVLDAMREVGRVVRAAVS